VTAGCRNVKLDGYRVIAVQERQLNAAGSTAGALMVATALDLSCACDDAWYRGSYFE